MEFKEVLKKMRINENMTQTDLSNYIGISVQTICAYENGDKKPNFDNLICIANYFGCSLDYLCGFSTTLSSSNEADQLFEMLKNGKIKYVDYSGCGESSIFVIDDKLLKDKLFGLIAAKDLSDIIGNQLFNEIVLNLVKGAK